MTDLFTRLSEDLAGVILFEWLREGEIGKLDSALCEVASRNNFLSILETSSPTYFWCQSATQFRWLKLRNIRISYVHLRIGNHISQDNTIKEFADYMTHSGSFVKSVAFDDQNCPVDAEIDTIDAVTKQCNNLQRLSVYRCLTDAHLINISKNCSKLRNLRYWGNQEDQLRNITDIGMKEVAKACVQFQGLHLYNCTKLSNESIVPFVGGKQPWNY